MIAVAVKVRDELVVGFERQVVINRAGLGGVDVPLDRAGQARGEARRGERVIEPPELAVEEVGIRRLGRIGGGDEIDETRGAEEVDGILLAVSVEIAGHEHVGIHGRERGVDEADQRGRLIFPAEVVSALAVVLVHVRSGCASGSLALEVIRDDPEFSARGIHAEELRQRRTAVGREVHRVRQRHADRRDERRLIHQPDLDGVRAEGRRGRGDNRVSRQAGRRHGRVQTGRAAHEIVERGAAAGAVVLQFGQRDHPGVERFQPRDDLRLLPDKLGVVVRAAVGRTAKSDEIVEHVRARDPHIPTDVRRRGLPRIGFVKGNRGRRLHAEFTEVVAEHAREPGGAVPEAERFSTADRARAKEGNRATVLSVAPVVEHDAVAVVQRLRRGHARHVARASRVHAASRRVVRIDQFSRVENLRQRREEEFAEALEIVLIRDEEPGRESDAHALETLKVKRAGIGGGEGKRRGDGRG